MPKGTTGAAAAGNAIGGLSWRQEIALFLLTTLLLSWPLVINGSPFYTGDSASYLRGGSFGFDTGLLMLEHWWDALVATAPTTSGGGDPKMIVAAAVAESGGVRSVIYSVTTYVFRWPGQSLIALGIFQASAVALAIGFIRSKLAPQAEFRATLMAVGAIALLTTAPWYAAYAMPDIFAGVAIVGIATLTLFVDRIGTAGRISLVLLIAYSITVGHRDGRRDFHRRRKLLGRRAPERAAETRTRADGPADHRGQGDQPGKSRAEGRAAAS